MLNSNQAGFFNTLFNVIDHSGNGVIEEADFVAAFGAAKRNAGEEQTKAVDGAARRCYLSLKLFSDSDKDKTVSKSEWQEWVNAFAADLAENGEVKGNFKRFTDAMFASVALGEKEVSKANYINWFSSLGLKGNAELIFDTMDEGKNGSLSKDEFYAHLTALLKGDDNAISIFGETTSELDFVEERINYYAEAIINGADGMDELAVGELNFYTALRRILKKSGSKQDLGMADAINDFLQFKGIIEPKRSFLK